MDSKLQRQLKQAGIPKALWDRLTVDGRPIEEAGAEEKKPLDRMNKLERHYSWFLDGLVESGVVTRYRFGEVKVRLADKTWYSPDFQVWLHYGRVVMVETKGWCRDDAAVKFKVARERYSEYQWMMVGRSKGKWEWRMGDTVAELIP